MGLRFAIWKIEAKLLGLVLIEALVFTLLVSLLAIELAAIYTFMWREPLATFFKLMGAGVIIVFVVALYRNVWSVLEDPCDEPLRELLSAVPELGRMVRDVARELKRPLPESAPFY